MRPVKIQIRLVNAQAEFNLRWAHMSKGTVLTLRCILYVRKENAPYTNVGMSSGSTDVSLQSEQGLLCILAESMDATDFQLTGKVLIRLRGLSRLVRVFAVHKWHSVPFLASRDISRTLMAQTPLGPWKIVRDMGSSSY